MFKPTKPHHIANKKYVDENSGGGGGGTEVGGRFVIVPTDDSGMPLSTLGEIREIFADGNLPLCYNENNNSYSWVSGFYDNGPGEGLSFIDIGESHTRWQSTSGSDDATWEYYD